MNWRLLTIAFLLAVAATRLSAAQQAAAAVAPAALPEQRVTELRRWINDFTEWKEWWVEWRGRREPGWFTTFKSRREKPAPPVWLTTECDLAIDDAEPLLTACKLLQEWMLEDEAALLQQTPDALLLQREDTNKITWWEHLHVDVVAPSMQAQSGIVGIGGMHASLTVKGRFQMFAAPGLMFVSVPSPYGGREWKIATNYGLGFRLFDFMFPGGRPAALHLNMAKAWMMTDRTDLFVDRTMDFFSFSIAFKKTR